MAKKKTAPVIAAVVFIICVVAISVATNLIQKYKPSEEMADLNAYYGFEGDLSEESYFSLTVEDEIALIVDNEILDMRGILVDDVIYLPREVVYEYLNARFYWDGNENVLVFTTPTEIIKAEVGSTSYSVGNNSMTIDYAPVRSDGNEVFIALDFVQEYTNIDYTLTANPNHLQIVTKWGQKDVVTTKKEAQVRVRGGIKSEILGIVDGDTKLFVLEELDDWYKVRTAEGIIGYISKKQVGSKSTEEFTRDFDEPEYTSISKDYTVNMVWHQMTSSAGNDSLSTAIEDVKGVNTISPTWFSLSDNNGNVSSIASDSYVKLAHRCGMEVWALFDNFSSEVSTKEVLSYTSKREKIINQVIAEVIKYNIDGINIDFESVPENAAEDFIEFIRELSTKCRLNGIVLSIDNYVPGYTSYYNREEQGVVADYVIIMGYDENTASSTTAGPNASIDFVRQGIVDTLEEVPANKVINAIPFYTRLWKETMKSEEEIASEDASTEYVPYNLEVENLGMTAVDKLISANALEKTWDDAVKANYIEYTKDNVTYVSWIEDAQSIEEKLKLMQEYKLAGVAEWKLGLEDSTIWDIILKYTN